MYSAPNTTLVPVSWCVAEGVAVGSNCSSPDFFLLLLHPPSPASSSIFFSFIFFFIPTKWHDVVYGLMPAAVHCNAKVLGVFVPFHSLEVQYEDDPLVDHFNVYLQIFLSQSLESSFLAAIRKSQGSCSLHGDVLVVGMLVASGVVGCCCFLGGSCIIHLGFQNSEQAVPVLQNLHGRAPAVIEGH